MMRPDRVTMERVGSASSRQRIDELYAKHTGQPIEQVHTDMERDRFFKPDEAVEYGLIDRVISSH